MNEIRFEMGNIDPRNWAFDHHGEILHRDAFISKMASVQLLEALIVTDSINKFSIETVMINHTGHMDDLVLFAIEPARSMGKIISLYQFAATVSVIDSLGPIGYKLIGSEYQMIVDIVYDTYQKEVEEIAKIMNCKNHELKIEDKIPAAKKAGNLLARILSRLEYKDPEIWVPEDNSYVRINHEDLAEIKVLNSKLNPLRASSYFMSTGARIMVAYSHFQETGRYGYSICIRSSYDGDLVPLWDELNKIEPDGRKWGGHSGVGGSPRKTDEDLGGSCIRPDQVIKLIKDLKI